MVLVLPYKFPETDPRLLVHLVGRTLIVTLVSGNFVLRRWSLWVHVNYPKPRMNMFSLYLYHNSNKYIFI